MKTKLIVVAAVVGWVCAGAAADGYDFYAGLQYPGAKLRPGVDVYKVTETGTGEPDAFIALVRPAGRAALSRKQL